MDAKIKQVIEAAKGNEELGKASGGFIRRFCLTGSLVEAGFVSNLNDTR